MEIIKSGVAGTLESSDVIVTVAPNDTIEIEITSSVEKQYGNKIKATVKAVLAEMEVAGVKVTVNDKGALDCTIKARLQAAVMRGADISTQNIPWNNIVR